MSDINSQAMIEVKDLSYSYGSATAQRVLADVSFSCQAGEFFSLLGPSGCGKTTVLRLLAGFDIPIAGQMLVEGKSVAGPGVDRGVVFQGDDSLFDWLTAADNVSFGPSIQGKSKAVRQETSNRFIDLVGLKGHERKYPPELSGGMRQRIQIARVLANDPKIMLMDEPFAALDAQTRNELQEELSRIWAATHKNVVFITHDITEAILLSDHIGVMTSGPEASIREVVPVDLPRPRLRSNPRFGQLYEYINGLIVDEVKKGRARRRDAATA